MRAVAACTFYDRVDAEVAPGQVFGVMLVEELYEVMAVADFAFFVAYFPAERTVSGIVFQEISEVADVRKVVRCDDAERGVFACANEAAASGRPPSSRFPLS